MNEVICQDRTYIKQWGKHSKGYHVLIYNSGAYATYKRIKNGICNLDNIVLIKCQDGSVDIDKFALENNYKRVDNIEM